MASSRSFVSVTENVSDNAPLQPAPFDIEVEPICGKSVAETATRSLSEANVPILAVAKVLAGRWAAISLEGACCGVTGFDEPAAVILSNISSSEDEDEKKSRGQRALKRFVRLSDNSFQQDDSRSALNAKLRSILQEDFIEDDEDYDVLFESNNDVGQVMGPIIPDDHPEFPHILTHEQMSSLTEKALPITLACSRWVRLYCLARDGDSLETFLSLAGDAGQSLLVVRNSQNEVFGAYADGPWRDPWYAPRGSKYRSTARSCLWRVSPSAESQGESDIEVYKWTGANYYIQLLDLKNRMIAFGGGGANANFGLSLGDDFHVGSTGTCATFGNEPLCQHGDHFDIVDVECWGFFSSFS